MKEGDKRELRKLIELIDQAYYHAMRRGQDTAAFILAMASLEVLEKIDQLNSTEAQSSKMTNAAPPV